MVFGGRRRAPRKIAACAVVVLLHHAVPVDKVVKAVIVEVVARSRPCRCLFRRYLLSLCRSASSRHLVHEDRRRRNRLVEWPLGRMDSIAGIAPEDTPRNA